MMRKQEGGKVPNCMFALSNMQSVRNYDLEVSVRIILLMGSHPVNYICDLGSRSVRFFSGQ